MSITTYNQDCSKCSLFQNYFLKANDTKNNNFNNKANQNGIDIRGECDSFNVGIMTRFTETIFIK